MYEQGLARSQFILGAMYADGEGVEGSLTKALEWFQKAAEQGHEQAIALLKQSNNTIAKLPEDEAHPTLLWNETV